MKQIISKLLAKEVGLKKEEIEKLIEIPPSSNMGDYSFPCFNLAGKLKKAPHQIALEIKSKIKKTPRGIEKIETSGGYVNFFLDKKFLAEKIIKKVLQKKENFGKPEIKKRKKIMVEFSQPNTHKAFHVGHIRGTSLGESLARILKFNGSKIIRANYQGDTGMHVAKWIWCYKKYHSNKKLKNDESWIAEIYVDAVQRLEVNPKLQEEVNGINKKLEDKKDKNLFELWKKTRKLSIDSFRKIYDELNTKFDVNFFESEVEKSGKEISEKLLYLKIAKKSEGAVIIDLEEFNLGVWVLLRGDGTVLYSAKDLALVEKKFKKFKINESLIVTSVEQNLHFQQLRKTLELMKFKNWEKYLHLGYESVRLPEGKMSSRTGNNILYSEFIKEMTDSAKQRIVKRNPEISKTELEKRALKISVAAIKYSMLKQNSNKVIIFDKEEALNFEGDTGPYLLYSYARANSILKKVEKSKTASKKSKIFKLEEKEIELVKKISQFEEIVLSSCRNLNPSLIANYSYQLAQIFNEFYHSCPVIGSEKEFFRTELVKCFKIVFGNCLELLGIEKIDEM